MKCLEKVIMPRGAGGIGSTAQKLANERAKVFLADINQKSFSKSSKQGHKTLSKLNEEINKDKSK